MVNAQRVQKILARHGRTLDGIGESDAEEPHGAELGALCGFGVIFGSVPAVLGVACLATGIPLFVTGADVEPGITRPEVHVGADDVQVSWRFQ